MKYITQIMCEEAIDDCLAALKFIPDWFVTNKMFEKLVNVIHDNDEILFDNKGFYKLILIMIITLMKITFILLFMSD